MIHGLSLNLIIKVVNFYNHYYTVVLIKLKQLTSALETDIRYTNYQMAATIS